MIRSFTSRGISMTSLVAALLLLAGVGTASAQTTETYDVASFSELEMGVRGTAYVSQGSSQSVEITGPQDVLEDITVEVRGGRLVVDYESRNWVEKFFSGDPDEVDVRVTMTEIRDLSVNGAGRLIGETPIEAENLRLGVSGAGEVEMDVSATSLRSEISGAGEMDLTGSADRHEISISGAGEVRAAGLQTTDSSIRVSGAGECEVHATSSLDVQVSGAGSVRYKGQPKISQSVSGAGSVKAM